MSENKIELKRPKFLTDEMENDPFYHSVPDPTKDPPPCHYNLLELTRYSTRTGKAIVDMTYEELQQFSTLNKE